MIEDPPLITVRTPARRPSTEQLTALGAYSSGCLVDAMGGGGALDFSVRAVAPERLPVRMCGTVLTCDAGPGDVLATLVALTEVRPGDVLLVRTGGWRGCAAIGDRVMGMLANAGGVGLVTDGLVRDVAGIVAVGLPVQAAGTSPNSPYATGPGTIGEPIVVAGVNVCSGDVLVADEDGAIVVPYGSLDEVIERARQVAALEAALDREVADGLVELERVTALRASGRIERVG